MTKSDVEALTSLELAESFAMLLEYTKDLFLEEIEEKSKEEELDKEVIFFEFIFKMTMLMLTTYCVTHTEEEDKEFLKILRKEIENTLQMIRLSPKTPIGIAKASMRRNTRI